MKKIGFVITGLLCGLLVLAESLPKVYLSYEHLTRDTFNLGSFKFVDGEDTLVLGMKVRHRGAFSAKYAKPSYAIKLQDENGKKYETSFLGMRKDNYWILDAMAPDHARMRNRVAMDLWLEMSCEPWYKSQEKKMVNGYHGQMVEVFLDDVSQGIYHLMERVDRKQLKLPKYVDSLGIQSALYKSIRADLWGFEMCPLFYPKPSTDWWNWQWEQKHPDVEDDEPLDWHPIYNLFRFVWTSNTDLFADSIASYIDLPVWMDYELFCQFITAWDNTSKNIYLSYYDTQNDHRALVTPWDLDHSFGRTWDGSIEKDTLILLEKNQLSIRLRREYPGYVKAQEARWAQLRKSVFNLEYVFALLDSYFDLYAVTGMDVKDSKKWSGVGKVSVTFDIALERAYIKDWLTRHVNFLDSYYHYNTKPVATSCDANEGGKVYVQKIMRDGHLYILKDNILYDCCGRPY